MAQFSLDPEAIAGKYEALREDVAGDREVMHKRLAGLEELNTEAHHKYAELQRKAHQLQQQLVFAKAGVPSGKTPLKPKPRSSRRPLGDARQTPKAETPAPEAPTPATEAPPSPTDMQPTYGDAVQQAQELAETETALQEVRQEHEASALSHQLEVDNLLDALEKKDRELREQDVRIETLLAFVPDKDVAMVFDGADKPPTVHDLGDTDLDAVAAGAVSPRHVDRPVIVARFPRKSAASSMDIRGTDGAIEGPPDAVANAPHRARAKGVEKEWRAAAAARRAEAAAQAKTIEKAEAAAAAPAPAPRDARVIEGKRVVEGTRVVEAERVLEPKAEAAPAAQKEAAPAPRKKPSMWNSTVKRIAENRRKAIEEAHAEALRKRDAQLAELTKEASKLAAENAAKDERLYAAARDVVDAKRESVDARARLGRAEIDLAVAHRQTKDESVGLRQRYEREAQKARLALNAEIRGATVEIRQDRDAALKRLEYVDGLLKAEGGADADKLRATRRQNKGLLKRVADTNLLRKRELAGYAKATEDLRNEVSRLKLALKKAKAPAKENVGPAAVLKARKKRAALEATRKYTFSVGGRSREYSFNTRAEPSQWHPRG